MRLIQKFRPQLSLTWFLLLVGVVGAVLGMGSAELRARRYQRVPITAAWSAKFSGRNPLDVPEHGLVSDSVTWDALWKSWHSSAAPAVDFDREQVIAVIIESPNQVSLLSSSQRHPGSLFRNGKGDVKGQYTCTLAGGIGFGYLFLATPRFECETINGQPVTRIQLQLPTDAAQQPVAFQQLPIFSGSGRLQWNARSTPAVSSQNPARPPP